MPRHALTVEDLWSIPRVGSPVPAADGSFAVVPVTTYSLETNEGICRLWKVFPDGSSPQPLTSPEVSSSQPALSPDGSKLAFLRKPGGDKKGEAAAKSGPKHTEQPQLYVLALAGGEAERLTDLPLGVCDPRWFPNGERIAFLSELFGDAPTVEGTVSMVKARAEDPVKAAVTEDRVYRFWDRWLTENKFHHVFALDLSSRTLLDVTPDSKRWFPLDEPKGEYRIAPDGKEIAFTAVRSEPPHDPLVYAVLTAKVPEQLGTPGDQRVVSLLTGDHPAHAFRPVYSPDGRFIVYGMQKEIDFYADRVRLVLHERGTGRHTILTEEWDRSSMGWTFTQDSRTILLTAEIEARVALFALDVEGAIAGANPGPTIAGAGGRTTVPREILRDGTLSEPEPAGSRIFFARQSLNEPPEVYTSDLGGKDLRRVTTFTAASMSGIELGAVEEITFEGAGGRPIHMFLVHPPESPGPPGASGSSTGRSESGASSTERRLPLVQVIHGGPHAASGDQWHWRWNAHAFAAPGYLVSLVNFHGSTGWGQEFAASILGRWGDQPYQDVMASTDLLIARGLVDPARMAAAGGSYGGFLASWIATQTNRFACIVNHAGVCDFHTQFASDVTQGRRRALGGSPWEEIEVMDRYNPMRHARGFESPMLILHGEKDYRVPYNQALEIYNVYKAKKVPARLVCYPDENHWILKPRNSRHWFGEVMGWLERWLVKGGKS